MKIGAMTKLLLFSSIVMVGLAGCAGTAKEYKYSGFLPQDIYANLKPDEDKSGALIYRKPDADLKKYNKFIFERIVVSISDEAEYKAIDPNELKALTDYFQEAIIKQLGKDYPQVQEPGPDVLRLKVALTELVPTKTGYSVVTLIVPYATVADLASGAASKGGTGSSPYLGETSIEMMAIDSMSNEVLVGYVERRIGKKYDVNLDKGVGKAVTEGYGSYFKSFTSWGYAQKAFDYWAAKLRQRLDIIHGKVKEPEKK